jgi:hypothetical protein
MLFQKCQPQFAPKTNFYVQLPTANFDSRHQYNNDC